MRPVLSALIVLLALGSAALAQSTACTMLTRMRQADVALLAAATRGDGAETQAAILRMIREDGPASGLDPEFVAAFVSAHDAALSALAGGARPETVLSDAALRASGARVSRYFSLFQCSNAGSLAATPAGALETEWAATGGPLQPAPGAVSLAALGAAPKPPVDGGGSGAGAEEGSGGGSGGATPAGPGRLSGGGASGGNRFPAPGSLGPDPWRADTQPWVYRFLSIFFLAFAAVLGVFDWLRRIHHRRTRRHPCMLPAVVRRRRRSFDGVMVELSRVGAEIRLDGQPLRRGITVEVEVKGLSLAARVVWVNAHFIGISFADPLDGVTHDTLLSAGQPIEAELRPAAA